MVLLQNWLINYVIENLGIKNIFAETDNYAVEFYKKYGLKTEIIGLRNKKDINVFWKWIGGNKFENFYISRLKYKNFEKCNNIQSLDKNK